MCAERDESALSALFTTAGEEVVTAADASGAARRRLAAPRAMGRRPRSISSCDETNGVRRARSPSLSFALIDLCTRARIVMVALSAWLTVLNILLMPLASAR